MNQKISNSLLLPLFAAVPALAASNPSMEKIAYPASSSFEAPNARIFCTGYGPPITNDDSSELNPALVRWGGNTSSRFNFKVGNIWNAGADWHFSNVTRGTPSLWRDWIRSHRTKNREVMFTLPIMGWLAKDSSSKGDPGRPNAEKTSLPTNDDDFLQFVISLREELGNQIRVYPLDNEPFLWHNTHHDAIDKAVTPREFAKRWLHYARLVRKADSESLISGPGLWGWADLPNLNPFLEMTIGERDEKGKLLLNIISAGLYPQNSELQGDLQDITGRKPSAHPNQENLAVLRATTIANFDDPAFVDPSWINRPVAYVPNIRRTIDLWSKKRGLSESEKPSVGIAEYNWGGAWSPSSAAIQAQILMKGLKLRLHHLCYFTWPPPKSPAAMAFRELRDLIIGDDPTKPRHEIYANQNSQKPWLWMRSKRGETVLLLVSNNERSFDLPSEFLMGKDQPKVETFKPETGEWQKIAVEKQGRINVKPFSIYLARRPAL